MKQKEVSTWLKVITIVFAIMIVFFFIFIWPLVGNEVEEISSTNSKFFHYSFMVFGFVIEFACLAVLYFFWIVCTQIGKDNSFSRENASAFVNISKIAFFITVLWFVGFIVLAFYKSTNVAVCIFLIFAIVVSVSISILAATLSHLILKAYEMKNESELTI